MENNWLFDKRQLRDTPSARDGIDYDMETRYRKEGARFIIDAGTHMNLRYDTMATAVEETPKKCKDMVAVARSILKDHQLTAFGDDPKEEVMATERVLLQTINFDLQVEHPYDFLLKYAKILKGDKLKLQKLVQMAWTFINDSLCTSLSLQWEPEIIAIALMYLASRLSKFEVVDWEGRKGIKGEKWWDQFVEDLSMDLLEDICHQVLDLYSSSKDKAKAMRAAAATTLSNVTMAGYAGPSSLITAPSVSQSVTVTPAARSDATKLPPLAGPTGSDAKSQPVASRRPLIATTPQQTGGSQSGQNVPSAGTGSGHDGAGAAAAAVRISQGTVGGAHPVPVLTTTTPVPMSLALAAVGSTAARMAQAPSPTGLQGRPSPQQAALTIASTAPPVSSFQGPPFGTPAAAAVSVQPFAARGAPPVTYAYNHSSSVFPNRMPPGGSPALGGRAPFPGQALPAGHQTYPPPAAGPSTPLGHPNGPQRMGYGFSRMPPR